MKATCEDHEGTTPVFIQQWDGKDWQSGVDWFEPMTDAVVRC
jgi:branched-chain amino acid transport system substrate-binding protein